MAVSIIDLGKILDRLSHILETETGKSPFEKDVAKALGLSPQQLSNMKKRGSVPYEEIALFAVGRKISINWILFGQHPKVVDEAMEDVYRIRFLSDISGSAGGGAFAPDRMSGDEWLYLDGKSLEALGVAGRSLERLEAIRVTGDSMEPLLWDGSIVLVDRSKTEVRGGGVYALNAGGMVLVKRLRVNTRGKVELISENPVYPLSEEDPENVSVIGRIVGSMERQ